MYFLLSFRFSVTPWLTVPGRSYVDLNFLPDMCRVDFKQDLKDLLQRENKQTHQRPEVHSESNGIAKCCEDCLIYTVPVKSLDTPTHSRVFLYFLLFSTL